MAASSFSQPSMRKAQSTTMPGVNMFACLLLSLTHLWLSYNFAKWKWSQWWSSVAIVKLGAEPSLLVRYWLCDLKESDISLHSLKVLMALTKSFSSQVMHRSAEIVIAA